MTELVATQIATIKCLSMTQPWASLVAGGFKRFETRAKNTGHRGLLAIQSATSFPRYAQKLCFTDPFRSALVQMGYTHPVDLPLGRVLSILWLETTFPTEEIAPKLKRIELAFGNYAPGRWAWELLYTRQLDQPVPARGYPWLWDWPYPAWMQSVVDEVVSAVTGRK